MCGERYREINFLSLIQKYKLTRAHRDDTIIIIIILIIISSPQVRLAPGQGHRLVQLRLHRVRVVGEQVGGPEHSLCLILNVRC